MNRGPAQKQPGTRRGGRTMNPWLLAFSDPLLEAEFRSSWLNNTRIQTLNWKVGAAIYYLAISLILQLYLPQDQALLLDIRLWLGLPAIVLSSLPLVFHRQLKAWSTPSYLFAVVLIFGITCLQVRIATPPHDYLLLFDMTVIYIFAQHYNRAFFAYNLFLIAGLTLVAALSVYGFGGSSLSRAVPFPPFAVTLAALTAVGIFAGYTREFFVRRNYLAQRRLQGEKARAEELAIEATQALEAKSRFLAIVGHELRTPLNAIIGFSELVLNGVGGEVRSARTTGYVRDIHQSGQHLAGLVESVLTYTQAGSGLIRIDEEVIHPFDLINNVCAEIDHMMAARHQIVRIDVADDVPPVRIDARQIGQCLANLLSNASKFSAVGSEIRCSAHVAGDGGVEITVTDTGPGLHDANPELLFDPFVQGDERLARNTDGLGIGLPLTRTLMRAHEGDVRLATRAGVGTAATLAFPPERSLRADAVMKAGTSGPA